jgi:hypothetical protein
MIVGAAGRTLEVSGVIRFYEDTMEVALVLMLWLGSAVRVPMPDRATCEQAIVGAKNDLNPTHVFCTPVARRSESITVSIIRNRSGPVQTDFCVVCVQKFPHIYGSMKSD